MGYTHYWVNEKRAIDTEWTALLEDAAAIINRARDAYFIRLVYEHDQLNKKPYLSQEFIRFNGPGEDGHETFLLERAKTEFAFCKTARKDYDPVVVAVLIAAANRLPGFDWRSDGNAEDHQDGMRLYMEATGTKL